MMTTFHCDKLCSGECCFHLVKALALVLRDHVTCAHIPNVARGDMFGATASMMAHAAIDDPAKLAELYVLALRARGFGDGEHVRITHWVHPMTKKPMIGIWWRSECVNADCDMSTARAKLLAIMNADPDESSREACEQILRGEP